MVEKNKVLFIGPKKSGKLTLIKSLFQSAPKVQPDQSHSGLIHDVELKTKYFSKRLQLWVDELGGNDDDKETSEGTTTDAFLDWSKEFKSAEYKEIRDVISGLVLCIDLSDTTLASEAAIEAMAKEITEIAEVFKKDEAENKKIIKSFSQLEFEDGDVSTKKDGNKSADDELDDYGLSEFEIWNGFIATVGIQREAQSQPSSVSPKIIREIFWDNDLDFVHYKENAKVNDTERDEYGDKVGLAKIKEIIDCHDWNDIEMKVPNEHYKNSTQFLDSDNDRTEQGKADLSAPLINSENNEDKNKKKELELDVLVNRIKNAKENALNIENQQVRDKFAKDFIDDIIDYI